MAGSSLFTLIDDIATLLDDVALMSKVAAKKTAGVLGDDLALNAQQVSGVSADRELPVVWAVAKGSFINKVILIPCALLISAFIPWLITPLLVLGGLFLCFEGVEKIVHTFFHRNKHKDKSEEIKDVEAYEKKKISGAVRTDFILSAEIIVIALGSVSQVDLVTQTGVLIAIGLGVTVGVYGIVAGIVKIDDLGLLLLKKPSQFIQFIGRVLLSLAPKLMKTLSIVGTAAMFLVGGGIISHANHSLAQSIETIAHNSGAMSFVTLTALQGLIGLICGFIVLGIVTSYLKIAKKA